jgi:UDP-3-O-[3-hydroxymyristoyl] N-acetylglucosamine deacetylase
MLKGSARGNVISLGRVANRCIGFFVVFPTKAVDVTIAGLPPYRLTVESPVFVEGVGLHSGLRAAARLSPAAAGEGIGFVAAGSPLSERVLATVGNVSLTKCGAAVAAGGRPVAASFTHLLAALSCLGVSDATVEVEGGELPVLDGTADAWVEPILDVGFRILPGEVACVRPLGLVRFESEDGRWAQIRPSSRRCVNVEIYCPGTDVGRQTAHFDYTSRSFLTSFSRARSFRFVEDVKEMRDAGLFRGLGLANTVGLVDGRIVNDGGLRSPNECAQHVAMDVVGALATAGFVLAGSFAGYRCDEATVFGLLRKLLDSVKFGCGGAASGAAA